MAWINLNCFLHFLGARKRALTLAGKSGREIKLLLRASWPSALPFQQAPPAQAETLLNHRGGKQMNLSEQRQCSNQSQQGRLLICPEPLPFRVGGFIKCIFHPRDTIFNPCPKHHFSNQDLSWNFSSAWDTSGRAFPGDLSVPRPLGTSIYLSIKQGQYLISGRRCHFSFQTAEKLHTQAGEMLLKYILERWPFAFAI